MSIRNFLESLSQAILAGIILVVGRLGVLSRGRCPEPENTLIPLQEPCCTGWLARPLERPRNRKRFGLAQGVVSKGAASKSMRLRVVSVATVLFATLFQANWQTVEF